MMKKLIQFTYVFEACLFCELRTLAEARAKA